MEQTNLVVTPDGKSWDEVTRDVSYIGPVKLASWTDTDTSWSVYVVLDEWRGAGTHAGGGGREYFYNKDFAIAYDRMICLVEGQYEIYFQTWSDGGATMTSFIYVNGDSLSGVAQVDVGTDNTQQGKMNLGLKRGDYVQLRGEFGHGGDKFDKFQITRL